MWTVAGPGNLKPARWLEQYQASWPTPGMNVQGVPMTSGLHGLNGSVISGAWFADRGWTGVPRVD